MIKIDVDTRCWQIPKEEYFLGVESDDKVRILQFEISKNEFYDGLNFTDCNCFINYKNGDNDTIPYRITDMEVQEDGTVTFTWEVSRGATIFKGNTFAVLCAKKVREDGTITNEWNSRIGSFTVSKGLEPSSLIVEVPEIDIISQLLLVAQQTNTNAQTNIDQSSSLLEKAEGLGYLKEDFDVLKARMDQFTSLQEGSTTGDAELIDGRIGYDGKVYDNIGGAIRLQVGELKGDIDYIKESNRERWFNEIEILPNKSIENNQLVDKNGVMTVLFPLSLGGVVYDFTDTCDKFYRVYATDDYKTRAIGSTTDRIMVCDASGTQTIGGIDYTKIAFLLTTQLFIEEVKSKVKIYGLSLVKDKINEDLYEKPEVQEQTENLITGKECILNGIRCGTPGRFGFSRNSEYTTIIAKAKKGDTVTSNVGSFSRDTFFINSNLQLLMVGTQFGIGETSTGAKYTSTTVNADGFVIISFKTSDFRLTNSESKNIDDLWIATKNLDELYKNGGSKKRVTNDALQGLYDSAYILPEHTTNYYKGKKIAYIGDSTGAPNTSGGCGEYRKYVNKALGLIESTWSSPVDIGYTDFSQGGSRMECESDANQYDSDGVAKESNGRFSACGDARVNALPQDCDIICIFMGVNASDHAMEKDTDTSLWSLENSDVTTFIGACNVCISKIMYHYGMPAYYDNIDYSNVNIIGDGTKVPQIIVMTPVHSGNTLSDKMESYQDKLNGHIMWRRKALEYMTGLWGTPYLDTQRCMMANPFTVPLYYRYVNDTEGYDKIHFNLRGAKQVANGLIGLLRCVEPISENITIV